MDCHGDGPVMSGVLNALAAAKPMTTLYSITPGTPGGSEYGYRTSGSVYGSLSPTFFVLPGVATITDIYSNSGNDLIITFNVAPPQFNRLVLSDSFGGTKTAYRSDGSIVGNSVIWASGVLGGAVYGSTIGPLNWRAFY